MVSAPGNCWRGHHASGSGPRHVDRDGYGIAHDVADRRVTGQAGELGKLIVVEVAGDLDRDLDPLAARADIAVQTEEALQVEVASDGGLQRFERDAAGGRVVSDGACQACRQCMQDVFARVGRAVFPSRTAGSSVSTVNGSVRVASSSPAP